MLLRWLLASLHLLALGIGLGAVTVRAGMLRGPLNPDSLRSALLADTFWGVAAILWIVTGLIRAFSELGEGHSLLSTQWRFSAQDGPAHPHSGPGGMADGHTDQMADSAQPQ